MADIRIRNFEPADAPRMEDLQARCIARCPDTSLLPAGFYWAPGFDNGKNIFCALDGQGRHMGHVAVYPYQASAALDGARVLWMDLRVDPEHPGGPALRDKLLAIAVKRAGELKKSLRENRAVLSATYFAAGMESIDYLRNEGFQPYETGYTLRRDLSLPVPPVPVPVGVEVRAWRMPTQSEQENYLAAHQSVFRDGTWTLKSLQHFMKSEMWAAGTTYTAFDGQKLAGSVMVYYNPDSPDKTGSTEHVFVLPKYRKLGIAPYLLREALTYLKKRGMKAAELQVSAQNRRAIEIYEQLGYTVFQEEVSLGLEVI